MTDGRYMIDVGRWGTTGERMLMRIPGIGGAHLLTAGDTGSGKTNMNRLVIAQTVVKLGKRVAVFIIDPDYTNYTRFVPRATSIAYAAETALQLLNLLEGEMVRRFRVMWALGIDEYDVGDDYHLAMVGPFLLICIEELQAIAAAPKPAAPKPGVAAPPSAMDRLIALSQRLRKAGGGLILSSQFPDAETIPTKVRGQCAMRWCGRAGEPTAATVVFGQGSTWPTNTISEDTPGVGFIRLRGTVSKCRIDRFDKDQFGAVALEYAGDRHQFDGFKQEIYSGDLLGLREGANQ